MKKALLLMLAAVLLACTDVVQTQTVNGPSTNPTPTPTASPTPAASPAPVATVSVARFGQEGTCTATPPQQNVTCIGIYTCTPRDAGGVDVGPKYVPSWGNAGSVSVQPATANVYNARVTCNSGGIGIVSCEVGGKIGSAQIDCVP